MIPPNATRRQFLTQVTATGLGLGLASPHAFAIGSPEPRVSAPSAILIDARTGRVLYQKNADSVRPIASTQKLLTALILCERGDLKRRLTVQSSDIAVEPTKLGLKPGQTYGRGYLMQAMLVKSCNDVARALGRDAAGSELRFGSVMTARAARLGCRNSRFLNASGLPAPGQKSSARDLAIIARAAYAVPVIRQIVRLQSLPFRYADGRQITLQSTNKLMKRCPYVTGMKTGYTNAAGKCLVSSGASGNRHVIAVILGSSSKYIWDESQSLIDYGLSR
jgi:D-alanyl-D-alanine carboxypeptidase (penicillin-binding protein 5/6)